MHIQSLVVFTLLKGRILLCDILGHRWPTGWQASSKWKRRGSCRSIGEGTGISCRGIERQYVSVFSMWCWFEVESLKYIEEDDDFRIDRRSFESL